MEFDLTKIIPDIRRLNDMREVLCDKNFAKNSPDMDLYFMYRGLEKKGELRYDITIVLPKMLGEEFTKTKGHYHVGAYGELYMVLEGSAIYLMQKRKSGSENEIEDCYFVKTEKGDAVVIPPYYGHITINPSENEELKMANWVSDNCKSDYSLFEKLNGACYFYTKNGWVKNENYKSVPELRQEQPLKSAP
ncbi:MAG: glucose-6-phosphate isomerase family protein, partial [Candidatus Staskawiczbacteria bacterium]